MKTIIQSVKGTRDFYPEEMAVRSWLHSELREVSESFGYQEYDGPFLEKVDLYAAKSGEELVKEQCFVFEDRGGGWVTLRPELTPSLARMVAQKQNELVYPLRWWSFGPFWRYERPQKGRTREFFQWNIDLIGASSVEADAELVAVCIRFFQQVGLKSSQVHVFVNNRRLMDSELQSLGVTPEQKTGVFRLIDRREKLNPEAWKAYAMELGLSETQFDGIRALLADPDLWKKSPDLVRLFEILEKMGIAEFISFDPQIIRGLDYYTGTVFEAKDMDREGRSILGGGHYDNLVGDVGGEPLPGVGFAMGDVMVSLVLQKYGCLPTFERCPAQALVTVFDADRLPASFALAASMRQAGVKTLCYPDPVKLQKQLKYADRMGVRFVIIVGPDEAAENMATVKDLIRHTQSTVPQAQVVSTIQQFLDNPPVL
ncbi:histidyl-tRNA synthetase [Longilinea arvoryzae]|uniref:Histidine--tRNA ligase n=1 Tax=Longilinea arvoryzae TaxID=360412 RepID=A0A0S7BB96_9CHLR|nr:histidine--tRNA ligase [Longilinea arvoryzae]GAP14919.1 histidyl-tRNA synthetase [Longilinea arvoryzae]